MRYRRILSYLAAVVFCLTLVQIVPAKAANPSEIIMKVGEERVVYAPTTNMATNNGTWTSNSTAVEIISYSGYFCNVRAKAVTGTPAVLTHRYKRKLSSGIEVDAIEDVRVTVEKGSSGSSAPSVTITMTVTPRDTILFVGETFYLNASLSDPQSCGRICYDCGNESVVSVDEYGRVTAVGRGATWVRAWASVNGTGGSKKVSETCGVTVVEPTSQVFFNANGGTVKQSSKTVVNGEPYGQMPTPVRAGYAFQGWYDSKSTVTGKKVSADDIALQTKDRTLYAFWEPAQPVSIQSWNDSTVVLSDPSGVLNGCTMVYAASYDGEKMIKLTSGTLTDTTALFHQTVGAGWSLFFLSEDYMPVCPKVII